MGLRVGHACNFVRNTGSYGTPTWVEIETVKDVTVTYKVSELDASARASDTQLTEPGMFEVSFEADILADTAQTDYAALLALFQSRGSVDVAALDGPLATSGSKGPRAICKIFDWTISEPLNDVSTVKMVFKPCYDATNPGVSWLTIA